MKQLEVSIVGHTYLLACPEGGEEPLQAAVALVDQEMTAIRDAGKVKARERIAVLAALNLAYQLVQTPAVPPVSTMTDPVGDRDADLIEALIQRLDLSLAQAG